MKNCCIGVLAHVDDGRTYRYCQVRFEGVSRAYSYLTDNDAIQPGDWVLVPLGQNDYERTGKVERVDIFTAANAPYPPERTKHIIGKTDAPPEPKTIETPVVVTPVAPEQKPEVIVPPLSPLHSQSQKSPQRRYSKRLTLPKSPAAKRAGLQRFCWYCLQSVELISIWKSSMTGRGPI